MPHGDPESARLLELDMRAARLYAAAPPVAGALLARLSAHHPYSARHSLRVAVLAGEAAEAAGLERAAVERAAMLHDVGKILVPVALLDAPRRLSEEEMDELRPHAALGAEMLVEAGIPEHAEAARHHHERFDGEGYPDGLKGEEIPRVARLLALCDSAEAMLAAERRWQARRSPAEVLALLEAEAGTQFDPELTLAFSAAYRALLLAPRPELQPLESAAPDAQPGPDPELAL